MTYLDTCHELDELGGGRYRWTGYLAPVAYRLDGSLRGIVADWADGDASFPHVVSQSPMLVYTAADGMRRICPTRDPARYVEIGAPYIKPASRWNKVNLGTPTRAGNRLTWTATNADVMVDHGGHFLKLSILLKNGWQPPNGQFAFPIGLTGLTRQGGTILADGVPVMMIRAPHVEDAANPDDKRAIAWDFLNVSGQNYVLFTLPDLSGMAQPLIDPTFGPVQPDAAAGEDTYVSLQAPTTNYGTNTLISIHPNYFSVSQRNGLVRFNTTTIPPGVTVTSGVLTLTTGAFTPAGTGYAARVLVANSGWTEAGATWNTKNGANGWAGSAGCNTAGTDYGSTTMGSSAHANNEGIGTPHAISLDATEVGLLVANNAGFHLRYAAANQDRWDICSSDHSTAGYRPILEITYNATGCPKQFMYYACLRRN